MDYTVVVTHYFAQPPKGSGGLAERVSAATLSKMIRQKETFLLALCTHIATHTRQRERSEMPPFGQDLPIVVSIELLQSGR
jgi:hypothetical protein